MLSPTRRVFGRSSRGRPNSWPSQDDDGDPKRIVRLSVPRRGRPYLGPAERHLWRPISAESLALWQEGWAARQQAE